MKQFPLFIACVTLAFALVAAGLPKADAQEIGRIDLEIVKPGFVAGLSGGRGALHYGGMAIPLHVISLGPSIAFFSYEFSGTVHNLTRPEDIYGDYTAGSGGAELVGGGKIPTLTNACGVRIDISVLENGMDISRDLGGIRIRPR